MGRGWASRWLLLLAAWVLCWPRLGECSLGEDNAVGAERLRSCVEASRSRVLLYTTLGDYSEDYFTMFSMMVQSSLWHLGPRVKLAVFAHHSWGPALRNRSAVHHLTLLSDAMFFDDNSTPPGVGRPSLAGQSSGNKLRVFRLLPAITQFQVILYLDADIILKANIFRLIPSICRDVLYVAAGNPDPEYIAVQRREDSHNYQIHDYTAAQVAAMRSKGRYVFNAGQFLFRPSARMEQLFQEAYRLYKAVPNVSVYEQGHLNEVFLLRGALRYPLTHLMGLCPNFDSIFGAAAILHFCGVAYRANFKLLFMNKFFDSVFQPIEVTQAEILARLSASLGSPWKAAQHGFIPLASRPTLPHGVEDLPAQMAAYATLLSQHDIVRPCEVGLHSAHSAVLALFHRPEASLTVFTTPQTPDANASIHALRSQFPDHGRLRVLRWPADDRNVRCDSILLAGHHSGHALLQDLRRAQLIARPPGFVFVSAMLPEAREAWEAFRTGAGLQVAHCNTDAQRGVGWCVGRFANPFRSMVSLHASRKSDP
eukprot:EG_transcript_8760